MVQRWSRLRDHGAGPLLRGSSEPGYWPNITRILNPEIWLISPALAALALRARLTRNWCCRGTRQQPAAVVCAVGWEVGGPGAWRLVAAVRPGMISETA